MHTCISLLPRRHPPSVVVAVFLFLRTRRNQRQLLFASVSLRLYCYMTRYTHSIVPCRLSSLYHVMCSFLIHRWSCRNNDLTHPRDLFNVRNTYTLEPFKLSEKQEVSPHSTSRSSQSLPRRPSQGQQKRPSRTLWPSGEALHRKPLKPRFCIVEAASDLRRSIRKPRMGGIFRGGCRLFLEFVARP